MKSSIRKAEENTQSSDKKNSSPPTHRKPPQDQEFARDVKHEQKLHHKDRSWDKPEEDIL
ncbi:hypothetical protein [Bdellovibrio sp. NC01]|uniref:hypothetical protein n=1 Tax=Bdellovibrio sp. NC01 TaxID=2220073 RepID=UPI0011594D3E|nr:hypothetical protein [Bdellovibrio sp. NC01]QDK38158.1 hypothetical protein DOE51_11465 [Bdellovibrio sp. NC01]